MSEDAGEDDGLLKSATIVWGDGFPQNHVDAGLDRVAVRVMRAGWPVDRFIGELTYLTSAELKEMAAGEAIVGLLAISSNWEYRADEDVWRR